jgi:probable 2-oxoglutarate dehydrogenase E1 component DHKTD1
MYEKTLVEEEKLIDKSKLHEEIDLFRASLEAALRNVTEGGYTIKPRNTYLQKQWSQMTLASSDQRTEWYTGCSSSLLKYIGAKSVEYPKEFSIHPTVERAHIKKRIERIQDERSIDWSTAEALALGSLLLQGFNVRISGQDVGRGTFSHRHAMLVDQNTANTYIPLNNLDKNQKNFFEICNSNLSEEAVMGFDFGFSLDSPQNLAIWEAQFGDFFNGAQIIIDQFISSGEQKWLYQSGLVLLLPHGMDGAGPEHSSARIERFLQMSSSKEDQIDSDNVNYYVCNPTTPANYFHLLRRQMLLPFRKPLIMASPKGLLRLPECVSSLDQFDTSTKFEPVLDDPKVRSNDKIKRLIFVCGKHYYELSAEKEKRKLEDVAIIRLEELSPFPADQIRQVISKYKNVKKSEYIWAQEEHRNQGTWTFVSPRFEHVLGIKLSYAGRDCHNTIAGIGGLHQAQAKEILNKAFENK